MVKQSPSKSKSVIFPTNPHCRKFQFIFPADDACISDAAPKKTTTFSWSAGASAGLLQRTQAGGKSLSPASWLESHALSLVLEGLVHERGQVSLAEAREDCLQPPTKNKLDLIGNVVAADHRHIVALRDRIEDRSCLLGVMTPAGGLRR